MDGVPPNEWRQRRKQVSNVIDADTTPAADTQPRETGAKRKKPAKGGKRAKTAKRAKAAKPAKPGKKSKPATDRTNKNAEVIAMMKRAKGATLAEIMKATGWQKHTVRGFVSILGKKGGEKIDSSKSSGPAHVQDREVPGNSASKPPLLAPARGGFFCFCGKHGRD